MTGIQMVSELNLPEWVLGDPADIDGYPDEADRLYLFHLSRPRFILAWNFLEDFEPEPGCLEFTGEIQWMDTEPPENEMALLLAQAARVLGACDADDRRRAGRKQD